MDYQNKPFHQRQGLAPPSGTEKQVEYELNELARNATADYDVTLIPQRTKSCDKEEGSVSRACKKACMVLVVIVLFLLLVAALAAGVLALIIIFTGFIDICKCDTTNDIAVLELRVKELEMMQVELREQVQELLTTSTQTPETTPIMATLPVTSPDLTTPDLTTPITTTPITTIPPVTTPITTIPPVTTPITTIPPVTTPITTIPPATTPDLTTFACGETGWTTVVSLDLEDPAHTCPPPWNESATPERSCYAANFFRNCQGLSFPVGMPYSRVCGRIVGYAVDTVDAFANFYSLNSIDQAYFDGVVVSHGSPRQHIWTLGTGHPQNAHPPRCPCDNPNRVVAPLPPAFVGDNYFCDSEANGALWDGQDCTTACCTFNSPPWFNVTLPAPSSDALEVRICNDHDSFLSEVVHIRSLELYVKE